jgi:kynurenine formamidase
MFAEPFEMIDLGTYLDQAAYPPWGYHVKHVTHDEGAKAMINRIRRTRRYEHPSRVVTVDDFPESMGLAWSWVQLSDHTGNHIDAPYHFGPLCEGKPAKTIDQVPLSWCSGPGVRLDFRHCMGRDITLDDIRRELDRIEIAMKPGMIPLLWAGADANIDDEAKYFPEQAGLSLEGLGYFLDCGVRLVAIDAYALDVCYKTMQEHFLKDEPMFCPAHFSGREREHMHLEKLTNLGAIPRPHGFYFAAFPIKLRGGSAGWVRPVAMVPRSHFPNGQPS